MATVTDYISEIAEGDLSGIKGKLSVVKVYNLRKNANININININIIWKQYFYRIMD